MQAIVFRVSQAHSVSGAMFRSSGALRSLYQGRLTVAGVTNCLLVKRFASKVDYTVSAVLLREKISDRSRFSNVRPSQPQTIRPNPVLGREKSAYKERIPSLEITAGGGPRPKAPQQWKTKSRRGSIAKSLKLVEVVNKSSNVKEEVYSALDAFIAWDLEFPLIALKKALKILAENGEWRRVIQVTKWMLDKGQGKTLATYLMLLEALDHEGRVEEAQVLWEKVLHENMECIPRTMFSRMISMYERHGKPKELLKVFADMQELGVKPDLGTVKRVSKTYAQFGYPEYAEALFRKYSAEPEDKHVKGRRPWRGSPGEEERRASTVEGLTESE